MRRAVFLDRDGVICENREDYVKDWSEFRLLPGVAGPLARLQAKGYLLVVVTNQSAINRGLTTAKKVEEINARMREDLEKEGVQLDGIYYCPHRPEEGCDCRKPKPGLFRQAISELCIAPERSCAIGDAPSDIQAGDAMGLATILVLSGRGWETLAALDQLNIRPAYISPELPSAADWILGQGSPSESY